MIQKVLHFTETEPQDWFKSCWKRQTGTSPDCQDWAEFRVNLNQLFRENFVDELDNRGTSSALSLCFDLLLS